MARTPHRTHRIPIGTELASIVSRDALQTDIRCKTGHDIGRDIDPRWARYRASGTRRWQPISTTFEWRYQGARFVAGARDFRVTFLRNRGADDELGEKAATTRATPFRPALRATRDGRPVGATS
ncbi:hypothetical protein D7S86_14220 [Pararobbsia silviterrae]|uniref:Uncharacterized protein n=1 Tax=Pararobbsia silviterrae TaxID=1792498 RepID=A0A494Y2U2_9BURK|nr:hypothetical protein D7S86_14220 [Pararobbsia silviterrae]